jgi:hypothetical protein
MWPEWIADDVMQKGGLNRRSNGFVPHADRVYSS